MTSRNQRITRQTLTPQRIKFLRRTSFKGRRMILGHSSNGSADEQEEEALQLTRRSNLSTLNADNLEPKSVRPMASLTGGLEERNSTSTNTEEPLRSQHVDKKPGDQRMRIELQPQDESYQTKINLERPNWDAADYYFKD
ncbi:hypothetical protein Tco_0916636 [Tanacetum coccineum]